MICGSRLAAGGVPTMNDNAVYQASNVRTLLIASSAKPWTKL